MNADQERWVTYAGRAGRLAQGFIFLCVGLLSAWAALRGGGRATDSRRALHTIVQQPFGQAVLLALTAGLVCYVLYRLLAAFAAAATKQHEIGPNGSWLRHSVPPS